MKLKYLRIKRHWLEAIERGEKTVEYRAKIGFYDWLGSEQLPFQLCFHYQTDYRVTKTVTKVELIDKPEWIPQEIISTDQCWAIHLG